MIINGGGTCGLLTAYTQACGPWFKGRRPHGAVLHSSGEPADSWKWVSYDDSIVNIVLIVALMSLL